MAGEGRERDKPMWVTPVRADGTVIDPDGGSTTIGSVDQGQPNAGGALAWPVTDAAMLAALGSPAQSGEAGAAAAGLASVLGSPAQEPTLQAIANGLGLVLARLDVALSTRASEATLALIKTDADGILAKLDVALSTRASEATLALLKARADLLATEATLALVKAKTDNLDVALSTRATEATLAALKARADLLATEATVATIKTDTAALVAKLDVALSTRATEATLATLAGKDFATQTTLAALKVTADAIKTNTDTLVTRLDVALSTRASEATLAALLAKFGSLGQKTMAGSAPVVIASDQSAVPVNDPGLPDTLGVKASAGSTSVVTASDDTNLASLKVIGAGAEATAQRVTLSTEALAALELIGVKGKDGSAISSDTNAVPVAPIPGQAGVAAGAGAVSALTQRMTLASDDPAVASLGTDGAAPPSIAGTGVRGWLRAIYAILLDAWDSTIHRLSVAVGRPSERANATAYHATATAGGNTNVAFTPALPAGKTLYVESAYMTGHMDTAGATVAANVPGFGAIGSAVNKYEVAAIYIPPPMVALAAGAAIIGAMQPGAGSISVTLKEPLPLTATPILTVGPGQVGGVTPAAVLASIHGYYL